MPKISIIVPIYKAEEYLCNCIESILSQSFTDFELILVNDGSPDNCGIICDNYALKDNRIKVIHKKNGGVSSARNTGLANATGEWIYFSDSDDELYHDTLEILTKHIDNDIAYVMAGYTLHNGEGETTYQYDIRKEKFINCSDAITQMFMPEDYLYHGYLVTKLFRTDIIKQNNLRFEEKIYFNEDRLFNVLYLLCVEDKRCFYTTSPVYKYIEREGSAMTSIKSSYNPKFATDLTAFTYMLTALKGSKNNKNTKLCKRYTFWSYYTNIRLMKKYNAYTVEQDRKLYKELRQHLSVIDMTLIILRRISGVIINRLKRII